MGLLFYRKNCMDFLANPIQSKVSVEEDTNELMSRLPVTIPMRFRAGHCQKLPEFPVRPELRRVGWVQSL